MSNKELAEAYLEDAEYSLHEAEEAHRHGLHHRVIRRSQECVELSLKAILRVYGVEYPKAHEVGGALIKIAEKLPQWLRDKLNELINASVTLAIQRAPSFYGDDLRKLPPKRIYNKTDAERALNMAKRTLEAAKRMLSEWITTP